MSYEISMAFTQMQEGKMEFNLHFISLSAHKQSWCKVTRIPLLFPDPDLTEGKVARIFCEFRDRYILSAPNRDRFICFIILVPS